MGKIYEWFVTMFGEKYAETAYRAARTFLQTFAGVFLTGVAAALQNGFDALGEAALLSLLASALSAAIAAMMNLPPKADENNKGGSGVRHEDIKDPENKLFD